MDGGLGNRGVLADFLGRVLVILRKYHNKNAKHPILLCEVASLRSTSNLVASKAVMRYNCSIKKENITLYLCNYVPLCLKLSALVSWYAVGLLLEEIEIKRIVCLIVVLLTTMPGLALAEEPVYFADANLKACVEAHLGIHNPTPTDMLGLTSLRCSFRGIAELTGLEYATNLTELYLRNNQISDISALSGLTNLTSLWLNNNQISDISTVAGLTNLTYLHLGGNQISDISAVSGLTNLSVLGLSYNPISDISALSGLTNLTELWLWENHISDISALSGLTNLTELWLTTNPISDISALSGLTNLTYLHLHDNQISDISAIAGLTNMRELHLYDNQISDISAVAGLTNLEWLRLDENQISDISALAGLTNLRKLRLPGNQISDISAVAGLTNLFWLYLQNNQISDISALSGLTNLKHLRLHDNQISDISAVAVLTNLVALWLQDNPLNQDACDIYIPLIVANNPGIELYYGECTLTPTIIIYVDDDAAGDPGPNNSTISDPSEDGSPEHPFDMIQEGIDAATDGDTVLVADGTYTGEGDKNLTWDGNIKHITVKSVNGPENCIIDCENDGRGFNFDGTKQDNTDIIDAFTIRNGNAQYGAAINCYNRSSPTIKGCILTGNTAATFGGAIRCNVSSSPTIIDCTINGNTASEGGGIHCFNESSPSITNCEVAGNIASGYGGGLAYAASASLTVTNCAITGNTAGYRGGGIDCWYSHGAIRNCTITSNAVTTKVIGVSGGGGISCSSSVTLLVTNCILWGNKAFYGSEIAMGFCITSDSSILTIVHSDLAKGKAGAYVEPGCTLNWDSDNIDADPCFADPGYWADANEPNIAVEPNDPNAVWIDGDYHLKSQAGRWEPYSASWLINDVTSLCIDAGDPNSDWTAELWPHGKRINMGAYGGTPQASMSLSTVADPLSEALDTALSFTTGGSADWFGQTTTFYNDGDAAQSGDISDDQESWMQTTVSGKGTVKFYWKVSSEGDFDCLEFYIDGSLEDQISGSVNWQKKTYTISTSDSHTLEWRYMKDEVTSFGDDCGWVDKVEWITTP